MKNHPLRKPRRSRQEIDQLLERFHASGQTAVAFAHEHDISPATLSYWIRRERNESPLPHSQALVEVVPNLHPNESPLEVKLPNGISINVSSGFDPDTFRQLLNLFQPSCSH